MPGLLDIIGQAAGMPTALAQQKLQYQMAQAQLAQIPQFQQIMQGVAGMMNGGAQGQGQPQQQQPQAQPQQPQQAPSQTTQSPTGTVTSTGLLPTDQASPGLLGMVNSAQSMINAAHPTGGLLPPAQGAPQGQPQQQAAPDPWKLFQAGVQLQGLPFPQAQTYGKALTGLAQAQIANDPANATRLAQAKSALSQDYLGLQQSQQTGDQEASRNWQTKLLTDAGRLKIANNNGAATLVGGGDINNLGVSGVNPEQGYGYSGGKMYALPGAAAAKAGIAGAVTGAQSANEYEPVYDQAGKQVGNMARGSQLPAGLSFGISPAAEDLSKGQGTAANTALEKYQSEAEAGKDILTQVQQIRGAASTFTPGKFAETRGEFLNVLNSAGVLNDADKDKLGSFQDAQKISIQLQAAVTKQLGSREAAQVFGTMGKSIPNLTMSPDGLDKVTGYLSGVARYNMARAAAAQQLGNQNNVAGVNTLQNDWMAKTNPSYYIFASLSPKARAEQLSSMGPAKAQTFMQQWNAAANAGYAPRPNDYAGQ